MASANVIEVTDANFETEVLKSNLPVIVDFWAEWCGPCKAIAPTIESLAGQFDGKLKVAKLNVDFNPQTASKYGIRGIPTLVAYKGGKDVDRRVGPSRQILADFFSSVSG